MVTDDERRLVAERLRMSDERDAAGFDCLLAEVVRGREFCETPCEECHRRLAAELADLIEPVERMCLYYDADTNHCGCYDTRLIDRDALLVLADEMENNTWYETGFDHHIAVRFARRIREALGVSDD